MEITLKQWKLVKKEVDSTIFKIPLEPIYLYHPLNKVYVEVKPVYTDFKLQLENEKEDLYALQVTYIEGIYDYSNHNFGIRRFIIYIKDLEFLYYTDLKSFKDTFIKNLIDRYFEESNKKDFDKNLKKILNVVDYG